MTPYFLPILSLTLATVRGLCEWLRVLRPGGYFVFHAPNSAYLQTAREMTSANMGRDFLRLIKQYPGTDYNEMVL